MFTLFTIFDSIVKYYQTYFFPVWVFIKWNNEWTLFQNCNSFLNLQYSQTCVSRPPLNKSHLSTMAILSLARRILIPILIEKPPKTNHLCTTAIFGDPKGGRCRQVWLYIWISNINLLYSESHLMWSFWNRGKMVTLSEW